MTIHRLMGDKTADRTDATESSRRGQPPVGWVLYDGRCDVCRRSARGFGRVLARRGLRLAPLQRRWVRDRFGVPDSVLLLEMRVLTAGGEVFGGIDAVIFIARRIWWARPLGWLDRVPLVHRLLDRLYRAVARNRSCVGTTSQGWNEEPPD